MPCLEEWHLISFKVKCILQKIDLFLKEANKFINKLWNFLNCTLFYE